MIHHTLYSGYHSFNFGDSGERDPQLLLCMFQDRRDSSSKNDSNNEFIFESNSSLFYE